MKENLFITNLKKRGLASSLCGSGEEVVKLKAEGVSDKTCQEIVGISRATYFPHQQILGDLERGILPPTKPPFKVNQRL